MGDTARDLGRSARYMGRRVRWASRHGGRGSRIGVALIIAGGLLLVVALIGAAVVNL